ncbi:MAG: aminodeoxychorismate lyase [Gammaproteobacteria bacterium]|nr:aminodeoxychorismate lyase [Gammaproteobacteria bacterium]
MQHISINGISCQYLSIMDRGLHYGDGLFETIACVDHKLQFWNEHIVRMQNSAQQLGIELSAIKYFESDVQNMLQAHSVSGCVIKLILTRGQSERGYRSSLPQKPTRIVILSDLPPYSEQYAKQGINACFCQHPVSNNSRLAGIKHLNRLDNVLARNEWQDEYQEGFMFDESGHLIEGTMSNVFAVKKNQLYTPSLNLSGVNGIIRAQILSIAQEQKIQSKVTNITKEEIMSMDEIFVCNSIIGIWPVNTLNNKSYEIGPITQKITQVLQQRISRQ